MAKKNRFLNQAELESLVRFGPELSGLKALVREAKGTYSSTVRSARGAADSIVSQVDQVRPQAQTDWQAAGLAAARSAHDILGANQPTASAGNSAVQNAILGEQAGIQSRIAESQGAELSGLRDVQTQAQQGAAWAQTSARNDLASTLEKVFSRQQDLAQEKGAFTASTARELQQAAQDRADKIAMNDADNSQSERNSLRSAGIDPNTGKPLPGSKSRSGGGGATNEQIANAQDTVGLAVGWANRLKDAPFKDPTTGQTRTLTRAEVAKALLDGRPAKEIDLYDPATNKKQIWRDGEPGNKDGSKTGQPKTKTRGAVPQIKSQRLLSVALDVAYKGYVSKENARFLHKRGLKVADLGVPSYADYLKKRRSGSYESAIRQGTVAGPGIPG